MSASVFAVLDTGTTVDDDGGRWPTVVIDADGHPEIADLARVHAVEGIGDIATEASMLEIDAGSVVDGVAERLLALSISISSPVTASFIVAFVLPSHREVLEEAAREGHLVIATTDPDRAADDRPLWLAIDLDPQILAEVLA